MIIFSVHLSNSNLTYRRLSDITAPIHSDGLFAVTMTKPSLVVPLGYLSLPLFAVEAATSDKGGCINERRTYCNLSKHPMSHMRAQDEPQKRWAGQCLPKP